MSSKMDKKYPAVPPRLNEVFQSYDAPLYFVTMNTWKRQRWLANDRIHNAFVKYGKGNAECGRAIGRYVIMPDHVHLFVRMGREDRLGTFVRLLKQGLSKEWQCSGGSASHGSLIERTLHPADSLIERTLHSEGSFTRRDGDMSSAAGNCRACRLWQPGFFDHVLRSSESYGTEWQYVQENPARAGLVARSEEWPCQGEIVRIDRV